MSLYRAESGVYYIDLYVRDPKTQRRKRVRRSTRTTDRDQAQQLLAKVISDQFSTENLDAKPPYSWKAAVTDYMKSRDSNTASYGQDLQRARLLDQIFGEVADVGLISNQLIETELKPLVRTGRKASTANRYLTFVKAVLNFAVKTENLNRCPRIEMFKVDPKKPVWLEQHEIEKLHDYFKASSRAKHLADFLVIAVDTGLRMRNITHLKWSDIDLTRRLLFIERGNTKGNREIAVPLTDAVMAILEKNNGKHSKYVLSYRNRPFDAVNPRTLRAAAAKVCIKKDLTAHVFRHTFATKLIMQGASIFEVMELGGWSKTESVQIYTHFNKDRLRETAQASSSFQSSVT